MKFKTADIRRYRYIFVGVRVSRISSRPFRNSVENGYGSKSNELHIGANYEDTGTVRSDEEHRFGRDVLAARELGRRGFTIRFVADRTPILFLRRAIFTGKITEFGKFLMKSET